MRVVIKMRPPRTIGRPDPEEVVMEAGIISEGLTAGDLGVLLELEQKLNNLTDARFHISLEADHG